MSGAWFHEPVMVREVVERLASVPPGWIVDATVGGGGHARALLDALPEHRLLGIDRDAEALEAAAAALAGHEGRVLLRRGRFDEVITTLGAAERGGPASTGLGGTEVGGISGVLFDLGVSSPQLDRAERGFSYRNDGPLDMRMDPSEPFSAADVVNGYSEDDLARVLARWGDERYARRIARAVVAARPLHRTTELAEVTRSAIPAPARRRGGHPARRTFQAIRIEVNGELSRLAPSLDSAIDVLVPRGRVAVISYHSGEDRVAKARFGIAATGGCTCPPGLPCGCGARPSVKFVGRRGGARPSPAELERNPRAESARLRVVEKLEMGERSGGLIDGPDDTDGAGGNAA
ncbi:MAG: 16S rRNA (cytosine(1402)-N(4))-methyltransferase RsmH [Acidimicrobiales bacterium]